MISVVTGFFLTSRLAHRVDSAVHDKLGRATDRNSHLSDRGPSVSGVDGVRGKEDAVG